MAIRVEHELHGRRRGRNHGLGLVLGAFVVLVFGLTVVKVSRQDEGGNPPVAAAVPGAADQTGGGY
jgi:ABC-type transporter Mla subunit MlaD